MKKTEVQKLAPAIWKEIHKAQKILLHLHPSPDGDSVGASLAMLWALESMGKKVDLIKGDSNPPKYLSQLPGFEKIVLKHYHEVEIDNYDLFVILDSMDMSRVSNFEVIEFPKKLKTKVIDHHSGNPKFGQINLVDGSYIATSQILYELFIEGKVAISKEMAICLYIGIYTDSGGFKYAPINYKTLEIASKLAKINPKFPEYIFALENNNEPGRISFIGLALNSIELYFGGRVAISAVSYEQLKKAGVDNNNVDKAYISNVLKSVTGWDVGIALVEKDLGVAGLSLRTRDPVKWNVAEIARATGGGDGHPVSAGASIKLPFNEAKKFLLEKIKEVHPEFGEP